MVQKQGQDDKGVSLQEQEGIRQEAFGSRGSRGSYMQDRSHFGSQESSGTRMQSQKDGDGTACLSAKASKRVFIRWEHTAKHRIHYEYESKEKRGEDC